MRRTGDERTKMLRLIRSLRQRGFEPHLVEDRSAARGVILKLVPQSARVCIGDSSSVRQLRVIEALKERGTTVINPFDPEIQIKDEETFFNYLFLPSIEASTGDVFLTGTNAITEDGRLLNVDGAGNRVAGMFWGHPLSIVVVGKNKIVKDLNEAFERVRNVIAPEHIRRRGGTPPCTKTGRCQDCKGSKRVCAITTIIEHKPLLTHMHVVVVEEDLGLGWDKSWPKERIERIAKEHERFMWSVPPQVMENVDIRRCWERLISIWGEGSKKGGI